MLKARTCAKDANNKKECIHDIASVKIDHLYKHIVISMHFPSGWEIPKGITGVLQMQEEEGFVTVITTDRAADAKEYAGLIFERPSEKPAEY